MNYVFFFPDEMRAEALGPYGNEIVRTPNYDRLAQEGTLFSENYTAHPVCVASRCSLFTGWYPHVGGYRTLKRLLEPWQPNFLRYLKQAGFETHLYGKNHVFTEPVFRECVDKYLYCEFDHGREDPDSPMPRERDYTMLRPPMEDAELEGMHDTRCVQAAIDAIRGWKQGDKPMFIFLPTLYPHAPYTVPKRFYDMYDPSQMRMTKPQDNPGKPQAYRLIRKYRELEDRDLALFQKIRAVYYGMVTYCDLLLGRLMEALDGVENPEEWTLIASSDHGDWAGDWGLVEKWPNAMDDDITRVPLMIRRPGGAKGHRVTTSTQTFDLFPTILDWEGIPIGHDQFGISQTGAVAGGGGDPNRRVYTEGGYDVREPHCFEGTQGFAAFNHPGTMYYPKMLQQQRDPESVCRVIMQLSAPWKLIRRTNGENELYNLEADPNELNNLIDDPSCREIVQSLTEEMLTWLMDTSDVVPYEGHV